MMIAIVEMLSGIDHLLLTKRSKLICSEGVVVVLDELISRAIRSCSRMNTFYCGIVDLGL
jgi:hypothetical protein